MSRYGRRIGKESRSAKTEFRDFCKFLFLMSLMLILAFANGFYKRPEYNTLTSYRGNYAELESRGSRRNRAYGLKLEDGSEFYIHRDFDREEFEAAVLPGDELFILADSEYSCMLMNLQKDPAVYEITTSDGKMLRSYDAAAEYIKARHLGFLISFGFLALLMAALVLVSFLSWRRHAKRLKELLENKGNELRKLL